MNAKTRGAAAKLPTNRAISFFLFLMVAGIIGAGFNAYIVLRDAGFDARYLELTGELQVLSQQISTSSRQATAGEAAAFDELSKARNKFNQTIGILQNGTSGSNALAGRYNNLDVDYWTPTNPTNAFPRPNVNQEFPLYDRTLSYFDGSFTKVRNITLGYNIPAALTEKVKIASLRVYVSAQNPFIFSNYGDNLDPEAARGRNTGTQREQTNEVPVGIPSVRSFLFGVNARF